MKTWTIFRFEFAYQVSKLSTRLYLAVLLFFTFFMNFLTTPGDGVFANNTFHITAMTVIGGFIWLVMSAPIAGEAAARDVQTRIHSLTFTTPVTKLQYLGGRFLAALSVNALLLLFLPLGVLLTFHLPAFEPEPLQPFTLFPYLNVFFLVALPFAFVATALQFSFSAGTKNVMTSYLASLIIAIFPQLIAISAANLFGNWDLLKLLDPVGIAGIVNSELGTWTPTEKNTRLLTLEGMFLWNRILWISIAIGSLLYTYARFNFANPSTYKWFSKWRKKTKGQLENKKDAIGNDAIANDSLINDPIKNGAIENDSTAIIRTNAISIPHVQRSFNFATSFKQTINIASVSFKKISSSPIGLTLVATIVLVSAVFGNKIMTQFGIPIIPTTTQVLEFLSALVANINTPWVVIPLLILYFTGELVWRERDARQSDLIDTMPVTEWTLFTGKFLGLAGVIFVWMLLLMIGGICMQLGLDYHSFEIGLYLKVLFGIQFIDYLLFALLAFVVHIVVNQKYIGYLLILLVFIFMAFPSEFGVQHPLLIFGKDPGWSHTEMRGFGDTILPWIMFKIYWIGWALLLSVIARLLWSRGREQSLKYRLKAAKNRFTGSTRLVSILATIIILTSGGFIFYNTNVLNEYQTNSDILQLKADYEKQYGKYRNCLQPQLTATKLDVEIYPNKKQAVIRAVYTLKNIHPQPIDTITLSSLSGVEMQDVKFDRTATDLLNDKKLGHSIYKLDQPLQPGDSLQLNFALNYHQKGFTANETNPLVVKNGTSFSNYDLLPAPGYLRHREINDHVLRKKYKLLSRPAIPSLYNEAARNKPLSIDQTKFEAIIGTAKDEVAVAPGALQKSWTANGRNYFHYKTDTSIGNEFVILSGNYEVKESSWNDVAIRIYYHPDHTSNIDRITRSAKASLEYFTDQFGPYPYKHLTFVERAGAGGGATADASIIYYGEKYALSKPDDSKNGFDLPYYILSHEVAHQWWGLAPLSPANVAGAGVLIEGFAVYSGMQVLEKFYDEQHLQRYIKYLHAEYEMPRSLATATLLEADEQFLYYRKAGLAMYALSKYIGKEKVNAALRNLLQKHRTGTLPYPTSLDLYQELGTVTPDSLKYLFNDLFKKNIYHRLKTTKISAVETKAGWEVTLKVQASKVDIARTGKETALPMNDLLEIGLYEEGAVNPLYLKMHRIVSGEQLIKVVVPRKPKHGGIDPNYLMIDIRVDDNVVEVSD